MRVTRGKVRMLIAMLEGRVCAACRSARGYWSPLRPPLCGPCNERRALGRRIGDISRDMIIWRAMPTKAEWL